MPAVARVFGGEHDLQFDDAMSLNETLSTDQAIRVLEVLSSKHCILGEKDYELRKAICEYLLKCATDCSLAPVPPGSYPGGYIGDKPNECHQSWMPHYEKCLAAKAAELEDGIKNGR